ncbi:MAG: 5-oxoprolinase/urea amidolyase family protein, partial [Microbacterium sp.]
GAYPRETPGGWRLIGTTAAALFDPDAGALLTPGTRVAFRPVLASTPNPSIGARVHTSEEGSGMDSRMDAWTRRDERGTAAAGHAAAGHAAAEHGAPRRGARGHDHGTGIRVVEPGLLATVQDLGRPGRAAQGIARSGALDRSALRTANRLVGNDEGAAGVEVTMGGFRAVAQRDVWFAVAGAWGPILIDGRAVDPYEAQLWPAGAELRLDWFAHGARAYLALRGGGVAAALVAGSAASDLMAGLGLPPLRPGDVLSIGGEAGPVPVPDIAPWGAPHDDELVVELAPGPRADWFAPTAIAALFDRPWRVTSEADRTGMRLDGPELERTRRGELPSEPMVPGALQVPPSGRPTILLADGPVTGGYPVIAVAADASLDALAQARPGTRIRFRHARSAR